MFSLDWHKDEWSSERNQLFDEFPTVPLCSYGAYVVPSQTPDFCSVSAVLGSCSDMDDLQSAILVQKKAFPVAVVNF